MGGEERGEEKKRKKRCTSGSQGGVTALDWEGRRGGRGGGEDRKHRGGTGRLCIVLAS